MEFFDTYMHLEDSKFDLDREEVISKITIK